MRKIFKAAVIPAIMMMTGYSLCTAGDCVSNDDDDKAIGHTTVDLDPITRYAYEFQWLPLVASRTTPGDAELILGTPGFMNTFSLQRQGFVSPFTDESITVTAEKVGDKVVYVWRLPEPEETTNCLYVAFVPRDDDKGHRVFTLEKSLFEPWVIGEAGGNAIHSNYGSVKEDKLSEADFVKLLKKKKLL